MRPSDLDPASWRRIDQIFDAALDTPPAERREFLAEACAGDDDLRAEVEALLEATERDDGGLDEPVSPLGAALVASSSSAEAAAEKREVGPFRIVREIGRGGMGVVYLAEDTRLGRQVALKALPPYLGVGEEAKRRFVAEARAVSALDHPNIATLFEADETEEGQLYMVFAFYEGETLEARIGRGPLPVEEAVEIGTRIAEGLAAAHRSGIIHRDVKPSNVLLTESGEVKLLDFGVAKVAGEELTGEGVQLGTVAYMSPEQASGGVVDPRTDLWSLGVVLYEMLTGQRPFQGGDPASLAGAILHHEPEPPASLRGDLSGDLERIIEKLLCKTADGRYRNTDDLLVELWALRSGESPLAAMRESPSRQRSSSTAWLGSADRHRRRRLVTVVLLALAAVGAGIYLASNAMSTTGRIERLAVLPLTNLTGDSTQQYLVDGVHDALTADLGKIGTLAVISRTSVMRYRDTELSVPEIAEQLGVDAVVEGSVFREGDSLAITAQLIAASPERHLWADTYRRGVGGVFEVASQVARSVAEEIEITLTPAEATRLATAREVDPAAYEAFTLGQFHLEQRSPEGFALAQRYLRRAIEIDSTFAPAYAVLAEAYGSAAFFGLQDPAESMSVLEHLAETSLALDSTLAPAHMVLAAVKLYWDWDWVGAESEARKAISINPSYARGYGILSEVLAVTARYQESLEAVERASELDQFVPFSAFRPVVVLNYMRDFDRALERARAGLEFFTDFWAGHWLLCESLGGKGLYDQAVDACEAAVQSSRTPATLGALGLAYALDGRREAATRVLQELEARSDDQYVGANYIAMIYVGLGDHDRALEWLDRAYQQRDVQLVHLANHWFFDPLHTDPRFEELLRKIGLEPRSQRAEG
ncbi:MAG: protein kinase [Gemmatimonadales bacterium]|jgi:serine/threonine-protein kinase